MSISSSSRVFLALAAAALAACSSEKVTQEALPSVRVPVEKVAVATLPELRTVAGTVRAENAATLSVRGVGTVKRVLVKEGDRVRAGQLLLEIDDRDVQAGSERARAGTAEVERFIEASDAAVRGAEANAQLAESTFKRFSALRDRGSVSAQEFDEVNSRHLAARAELDRAQRGRAQAVARRGDASAALAQANAYVDFASIRAPFDGFVTGRFVDPGAQAAPGIPLLAVEQSGPLRVEVVVDETLARTIHAGDRAAVRIDGQEGTGTVTQVVGAVDPTTRGALVKLAVPARAGLRSGSYANVSFTNGTRQGVTIPEQAVVRRGSSSSVFVVDQAGVARLRLVTTGRAAEGRVEVLSGLDAGDSIVSTTSASVRDGVRITPATATAAPQREPS